MLNILRNLFPVGLAVLMFVPSAHASFLYNIDVEGDNLSGSGYIEFLTQSCALSEAGCNASIGSFSLTLHGLFTEPRPGDGAPDYEWDVINTFGKQHLADSGNFWSLGTFTEILEFGLGGLLLDQYQVGTECIRDDQGRIISCGPIMSTAQENYFSISGSVIDYGCDRINGGGGMFCAHPLATATDSAFSGLLTLTAVNVAEPSSGVLVMISLLGLILIGLFRQQRHLYALRA